jgi:processing peptidase subunit alpha
LYPFAESAPEITTTTVEQVAEIAKHPKKESLDKKFPPPHTPIDHFDDAHTLGDLEEDSVRKLQKQRIPTTLSGCTEITPTVPSTIPPNVPSDLLEIPTTQLSTLPNGVRVVSQETYGQVSCIGVLINVGSRHETVTGTCHLLETLAFHSTSSYNSAVEISQQLQDWGATSFANTGREQTLYCLDILRPNVNQGMKLLSEVILSPKILDEEVVYSKRAMEYQWMDIMPEILLTEVLQQAAYGNSQQLGKPHLCPPEALNALTANVVKSFCHAHVIHNPQGLVVAGAGMDHAELVDMAQHYFGHLQQHALPEEERTIPSVYHGGEAKLQHKTMDGYTRCALAFELGGWHSDDLVPTCVLQTLLGGGSSFSAGGPGKGMYSRLYRQVLNRYYWAQSAEAFTSFHNETGLFGMIGSSEPDKSRDVVFVLAEHFGKLAMDLVTDEEFERARNMLKNNVLSQLESRLVLFEDMGRQVLTYGHREDTDEMCRKINAVTKEDLRELIRRAMQQQPTLVAVGDDVSKLPALSEVKGWLH